MQRTIQQITQDLINRLPENDQYYRLDELRSWGYPSFVVRRIRIELERNLAESMVIPKTDWANTRSDAVLDAWQQFVDAIRAEARLPASYAHAVIETAVADVVEMLVQPQKNIPEVIFGKDDRLSDQELRERLDVVVVYRHFSELLRRYMEKRGLEELSRERCKKIIAQADKKFTSRYSPLNWAQMLDPLFKLVGGDIDSNLLRLFFEDKDMPRLARKFDLMNTELSRAELIEALSSPDSLNFEGYRDDQSSLFEDQPEESSEGDEPESDAVDTAGEDMDEGEEDNPTSGAADTENEVTLNSGFSGGEEREKSEETGSSLNDVFEDTEKEEDEEPTAAVSGEEESARKKEQAEAEPEAGADTNTDTDIDTETEGTITGTEENSTHRAEAEAEKEIEAELEGESDSEEVKEEPAADEEKEEEPEQPVERREEPASQNGQSQEPEKRETPMWMRYMSDEEIEEYRQQEEESEAGEEDFIEEPIIDLTNENASEGEIERLRGHLSADRELFVEEIFGGSDRAFDEAVEKIAAYESWRDVSKFIEKEIFKRNLVDMYSEAAVDFTDCLQNYFLEKQNRN